MRHREIFLQGGTVWNADVDRGRLAARGGQIDDLVNRPGAGAATRGLSLEAEIGPRRKELQNELLFQQDPAGCV